MTKISALPQDTAPTTGDSVPAYDLETTTTKRVTLSDLITLFFNNIPTGSPSPITRHSETMFDFVASGLVWSGDSYASTRAASMTAGVVYINGRRITISAVVARTFTASKDTYIDILDNADGTGTLVYTEATNNAASSALAANSIRIGIIVTGASSIAAVGSVNQGQETKVLPIASAMAYCVTDSLGNLICPRDANRRILGGRSVLSVSSTISSASPAAIPTTPLRVFVNIPTGRKIRCVFQIPSFVPLTGGSLVSAWYDVTSSVQISQFNRSNTTGNLNSGVNDIGYYTPPAAGARTIEVYALQVGGNGSIASTSAAPAQAFIELV